MNIEWENSKGEPGGAGFYLFWTTVLSAVAAIHTWVVPVQVHLDWARNYIDPKWLSAVIAGLGTLACAGGLCFLAARLLKKLRWYRRTFRNLHWPMWILTWMVAVPFTWVMIGFWVAVFRVITGQA